MKRNPRFSSILLLILVFIPGTGRSKILSTDDTWTSIGPPGGAVRGLDKNPRNPNEVYAIVDGDPGRVFKSTNGGTLWKMTAAIESDLYDIAINPTKPNVIYVLGGTSLFKSNNKGVTFTEYPLASNQRGYSGRLAVHPSNPDILYACGTYQSASDYSVSLAIFKSVDGGVHWSLKTFNPSSYRAEMQGIAVHPANPNLLYAFGYRMINSNYWVQIFKSLNGGGSWTNITGLINSMMSGALHSIALDPADLNKVYLSLSQGVFRSSNGGKSWAKQKSPAIFSGGALLVDPLDSKILYAGTNSFSIDKGFYKSKDNGANWIQSGKGFYGDCISLLKSKARLLYGSTAGIFGSLNAGVTWTASHSGLTAGKVRAFALSPSAPATIFAGLADYALFKTSNGGETWTKLPDFDQSENLERIAVHPSDPKIIYVLTSSKYYYPCKIYKSVDGGLSWKELFKNYCNDFFLNSRSPNHLFAAGQVSLGDEWSPKVFGIHSSGDGGKSWKSVKIFLQTDSQANAIAVDPANDKTIYVGGRDANDKELLYKSLNGGATWTKIPSKFDGEIKLLALDPNSPGTIYVGSHSGTWRSMDAGATWIKILWTAPECLLINPADSNELFAGLGDLVISSVDKGDNWIFPSEKSSLYDVRWLTIEPKAGVLYAGTLGGGIFRKKL